MHAVGQIGVAKAIGAQQRDAALAGDARQFVLLLAIANFGKAAGKYHDRFDLAPGAGGHRFFRASRRQCEDRQIDTLGQLVDFRQHRATVDFTARAARQDGYHRQSR